MKKLIMISTPLPPHPCGQGNYTAMLRRFWPEDNTKIIHLVTSGAAASKAYLGFDDIHDFQPNYSSLVAQLNRFPDADILMQYAGRGYNRFGCPYWLPAAIQRWRQKQPDRILFVMFHELWSALPPWKKHFLTETLNKRITKQLINVANVTCCLTQHQTERLQTLVPTAEVSWIPVGTNIPPTQAVDASFAKRAPKQFLIFGLQYTRLLTLRDLGNSVEKLYRQGLLEKLHLVGPVETRWDLEEKELLKRILPTDTVKYHGVIPPEEVSRLLHHVGFCIIGQPPENFTKSSSFMAFASHGCCISSPYADPQAEAPVCYLTHPNEILQSGIESMETRLVERGQNLLNWYFDYADWQKNVGKIARTFKLPDQESEKKLLI